MNRAEVLAWLEREALHYDCEDSWYSCATLTSDHRRQGDPCDCGADTENLMRKAALALLKSNT